MSLPELRDKVVVLAAAPPPGARFQAEKDIQASHPISQLAAHIRECWVENRNHKVNRGIQETMLQCTRQRNGEYDPDDKAKVGEVDVYINVTGLKCRAAESWIKDVLVNAEDQPWVIEPTPLPDLSADLNVEVAELVRREVMARGYVDREQIKQRVEELRNTALAEQQRLATEACDRMSRKINDQMTEGGWKAVFEQWQSDIVTYPAGVLKGPVVRNRRTLKWDGNSLVTSTEAMLVCERVSPLDLYPSPEASTPQDANSIIEIMRMTKAKLYECIGLPNFSEDAIRLALDEYEHGYRDWLSDSGERARSEKKQANLWASGETIDVIDFWGRVQGSVLQEWGIEVEDAQAQYECNAWLIGEYVIRALINPDPLGRRPYRVTSFNKLPGQFWGEGIPQLIRHLQRSANAAARALLRNMAYASGPIVEVDVDRLDESEDRPEEIKPWRLYYTKPSNAPGGGGAAIRFITMPSIAGELMGIFDRFMVMADDFSGVPAYSYGNTSAVGGGAKTMGGLSLLYGNALKGIKNVIMNMDRDGIEPTITQIWTFNMLYDPDESLKADAKVVAKGAEGLLQKEQAQARSIETLQVINPLIQAGIIPRQGAQYLAREWLRQQGYDLSNFFPNSDIDQEIAGTFGNGAPGAPQASPQPGTSAPPLDGRQGAALQALQDSQI
ncbi:hypothetical protein [Dyella sp.]|uniref:portal protein n=1 Tax=Dyella sp. TaxID=1869338 RepID=UPI002FD8AF49